MWTKIKWGIRIFLILIVGAFLHYTLPLRDVVVFPHMVIPLFVAWWASWAFPTRVGKLIVLRDRAAQIGVSRGSEPGREVA